jgi:hypothetical protein
MGVNRSVQRDIEPLRRSEISNVKRYQMKGRATWHNGCRGSHL